MPTFTPIYDFNLPLVNNATDENLWGGYLNDNWSSIDTLLFTATNNIKRDVTGTDTATVNDRNKVLLCDASGGAFSVTLPLAATAGDGFQIAIKRTNATNNVTIDGSGSETIDGALTYVLSAQYDAVVLQCDGANWNIISKPTTVVDASDTVKGIVELATAAETLVGTDAVRALTAAGMAGNKSLANSGYYKLPGGLILQWGRSPSLSSGTTTAVTLPTAFATGCFAAVAVPSFTTGGGQANVAVTTLTTTQISIFNSTSGPGIFYYFAVGV